MYEFLDRYFKKFSMTDTHDSKQAFKILFLNREDRRDRTIAMMVIIIDPKAMEPKWYLKAMEALVRIGLSRLCLSLQKKVLSAILEILRSCSF